MNTLPSTDTALIADIRQLIDSARQRAAVAVNAELTRLYWQIGRRMRSEVLHGERAAYGQQIIATLSARLTDEYGRGWGVRHLRNYLRIAEQFSDEHIVNTLCAELSWSHLRLLVTLDDPFKRDFYIELCRLEHWSVRQLQECIHSMLYEQSAISKKTEETIRHDLAQLKQTQRVSPETILPSRGLLQAKLHQSIAVARQRLLQDKEES